MVDAKESKYCGKCDQYNRFNFLTPKCHKFNKHLRLVNGYLHKCEECLAENKTPNEVRIVIEIKK